jgi:phage recombination protein Bet
MAMANAQKLDLSPEAKQIYFVKRWDSSQNREVMETQISIDGQRLVAERTGLWGGLDGPFWCGTDGLWLKDADGDPLPWLADGPPAAAMVRIHKKGWQAPRTTIARFKSYAGTKKDGELNSFWAKMGDLMIGKCAEALGLRGAFPNELGGLYTPEEMQQTANAAPPVQHVEMSVVKEWLDSANSVDELRRIAGNFAQRLNPDDVPRARLAYEERLTEIRETDPPSGSK